MGKFQELRLADILVGDNLERGIVKINPALDDK